MLHTPGGRTGAVPGTSPRTRFPEVRRARLAASQDPASLTPRPSARQRGITTLDTAIIMIAFVVVASVAAFATLETGFFAASESRTAILSGITEAKSSVILRGGAIASRGSVDIDGNDTIVISSTSTDKNAVVNVTFIVTGSLSNSKLDLTRPYTKNDTGIDPDASGLEHTTTIAYRSDVMASTDAAWTVRFIGSNDGDYILEERKRAEITVWLNLPDVTNDLWDLGAGSGDPFLDSSGELLLEQTLFEIEIAPPGGGVVTISRTTPNYLGSAMDLN